MVFLIFIPNSTEYIFEVWGINPEHEQASSGPFFLIDMNHSIIIQKNLKKSFLNSRRIFFYFSLLPPKWYFCPWVHFFIQLSFHKPIHPSFHSSIRYSKINFSLTNDGGPAYYWVKVYNPFHLLDLLVFPSLASLVDEASSAHCLFVGRSVVLSAAFSVIPRSELAAHQAWYKVKQRSTKISRWDLQKWYHCFWMVGLGQSGNLLITITRDQIDVA